MKSVVAGYDGKGQRIIESPDALMTAWTSLGKVACTLEHRVDLAMEISVLAARGPDGQVSTWRPVENRHHRHILDLSLAPADISPDLEAEALALTVRLAERLALRGLLCVEFFVTRSGEMLGELLINEIAPRPHNSGHYTLEATPCSQFEQQIRAVCGLPLGSTRLRQPAAMANLLGDLGRRVRPIGRRPCAIQTFISTCMASRKLSLAEKWGISRRWATPRRRRCIAW